MEFVAKLYGNQVEEGRVFLHEHPAHAKSWGLSEIRKVMAMRGRLSVGLVRLVTSDDARPQDFRGTLLCS